MLRTFTPDRNAAGRGIGVVPSRSVTTMRRAAIVLTLVLAATTASWPAPMAARADVPARLTDREFWTLSQDASEPGGYFRAQDITNLTSNELWYQHVIPDLVARTRPGGVYLGVGPEQNFTYIAALKPRLAIIFDIRRGNLDTQLMYKALFELAKDRAEFVSLLFAKPRPEGLLPAATAHELFSAFAAVATHDALYRQTASRIEAHLVKTRGLALPARDLEGIRAIYETFYASGFYVRASPSYWDLMAATDAAGVGWSYLSTEAAFATIKDLHTRNLIVPVVGDFAGPKAIRAIGQYLKSREAIVTAFYLSNVEQYLYQDGKWDAFCRNVAALPLGPASTFIRSESGRGGFGRGGGFISSLGAMAPEVQAGCGRTVTPGGFLSGSRW
jgi:hypothetical protein